MSYEICSHISINEKKNRITLTVASSNVYPRTFTTCEYGNSKMSFKEKIKLLLVDVDGGCIQPYNSTTEFMYAFYRMKSELNIDENLYNIRYYMHNANIYHLEGSKPRWGGNSVAINQTDILSGEYKRCSDVNEWYYKTSEIVEHKAKSDKIMNMAYELFMKYYKKSAPVGKFVISKNDRLIKPTHNGRYCIGVTKEMIKSNPKYETGWVFDYKKAYVLSKRYNAEISEI